MFAALQFLTGNWTRILVYAVVAAAVLAVTWFHGLFTGRAALVEYKAEQATQAAKVIIKQGAVTERVVTQYVTKTVPKTRTVTETVEKEVIRYVAANPDGICLDPDWRRLHDSAALNAVPAAAGAADAALRAPAGPATGLRRADGRAGAQDSH